MINAAELLDNLVALLRDIPELITEMGGDPERIYAYHDQYPKRVSVSTAIHQMPAPAIMAVWQGRELGGFGGVEVWRIKVGLYLRAGETLVGDPPGVYDRLHRLIVKGVPSSLGIQMLNATVHPSCHPMDPPPIHRQTDAEGLDYFEVNMSFVEAGDE